MEKNEKILTFTPPAWGKMRWFMKKAGNLEMTGFGITEENNPLYVIDFQTVKQEVTEVLTTLDDAALGEYVAGNAKRGIIPACCMRIWIHSHPFYENAPTPSGTDLSNLRTKFMNEADWAVMVILGQDGCFAKLHSKLRMGGDIVSAISLKVKVDWMFQFRGKCEEAWEKEFEENIKEEKKKAFVYKNWPKTGGYYQPEQENRMIDEEELDVWSTCSTNRKRQKQQKKQTRKRQKMTDACRASMGAIGYKD